MTIEEFLNSDIDTPVAGSGAVFGLNMDGSVDQTDVGRMSEFNAHHGAYQGVDLRDPNLRGMAIGDEQAKTLGFKNRDEALGHVVKVVNYNTGLVSPIQIVDKAPRAQQHVEMTPAAHAEVGSTGRDPLGIARFNSVEDFLGIPAGKPSVDVGTVTSDTGDVVGLPAQAVQQQSNLPPEEQGLQNILEKNLTAGAAAGVYPKAQRATQNELFDARIAKAKATEQPPPDDSFLQSASKGIRGALNLPKTGPIIEQDIADTLGGAGEAPLFPSLEMPMEERTPQKPIDYVTKTGYNILAGIANFANKPTGAATIIATGGLSAAGKQLVTLGFAAQGVKGAIDHAMQGDLQGAAESLGIGALAAHGAKDIGKTPEVKPSAVVPEGLDVQPDQPGPRGFQMQSEARVASPVEVPATVTPPAPENAIAGLTGAPQAIEAWLNEPVDQPLNAEPPPVSTAPSEAIDQGTNIRPVPTGLPPGELAQAIPERAQETGGVATRNAYTDARRDVLGLEQPDAATVQADAQVQAAAQDFMQRDPGLGQKLAETLSVKPTADTGLEKSVEQTVLRNHIASLEQQHTQLIDHINATQDPASVETLNQVRDNLQTAFDAARKSGTELGRGLRQRRVEEAARYSLARMEAERRAVNGGEPLAPEKLKETEAVSNEIRTAREQLAAREQAIADGTAEVELPKTRKGVVNFLDKQAEAARQRIIARRGRLNVGIDPTAFADEIIIGASHVARGVSDFGAWSKVMLRDFGDRVKPYLNELYNRALALHEGASVKARETALKAFEKRTGTRITQLEQKVATGDVTPAIPRSKLLLDPKRQELADRLHVATYKYQMMLEKDRLAKRSWIRKIIDTAVAAERSIKLTSLGTTVGKLPGAGIWRLGQSAAEEVTGTALSFLPVTRRVMRAATAEGAPTLRSIKAGYAGFKQGVREIPSVLRGEKEARDVFEGRSRVRVPSILDIPGRIHGAVKQPFKMSHEAATFAKIIDATIRRGELEKPGAIEAAREEAKTHGLRAILTNDNVISSGWTNFMQWLEHNKKFPTGGYIAAKIGNFLLPIVRVPTNLAIETGQLSGGGLVAGSYKLMEVMKRGMDTITPQEANFIARNLKKGSVGAGLFALGYFNPDNFGGFYVEKEHKKGVKNIDTSGVRSGQAKVFGRTVPRLLLHSPAFMVMQLGATTRKLMDAGRSKGETAFKDLHAIMEESSFVSTVEQIDDIFRGDDYHKTRAEGYLASGTVVPGFVKDIGYLHDPRRRAPKTVTDYAKVGVPYLQEDVPLAKYQ